MAECYFRNPVNHAPSIHTFVRLHPQWGWTWPRDQLWSTGHSQERCSRGLMHACTLGPVLLNGSSMEPSLHTARKSQWLQRQAHVKEDLEPSGSIWAPGQQPALAVKHLSEHILNLPDSPQWHSMKQNCPVKSQNPEKKNNVLNTLLLEATKFGDGYSATDKQKCP